MTNSFYNATGMPGTRSAGSSSAMRAQLSAIAAAFDKMPTLSGSAYRIPFIDAAGAIITTSANLYTDAGSALRTGSVDLLNNIDPILSPTVRGDATTNHILTFGWNHSGGDGEWGVIYAKGAGSNAGLTFYENQGGSPPVLTQRGAFNRNGTWGVSQTITPPNFPNVGVYTAFTGTKGRFRAQSLDGGGVVIDLTANSSLVGAVGTVSNHALLLQTNSSERMRITGVTGGEAHITLGGALPRSWDASMNTIELGALSALMGNAVATYLASNWYYDGANWRLMTAAAASLIGFAAGNITFYTGLTGAAGAVSAPTAQMAIANNGNVTMVQGLGINGKSAVADVARPANPTDLASSITRITNILDKLQQFGLYT